MKQSKLSEINPARYRYTAYIVGGGPSLKNFNWNLLGPDKFVVAINRSYEVLPNAQIIYFTDKDYWDTHKAKMLQHKGIKVRGVRKLGETKHPDVHECLLTGERVIETKTNCLKHGRNSTYAALNLLTVHLGFREIYLLGIDMKWGKTGNKKTSHWHSGHKRIDPETAFSGMIRNFKDLKNELDKLSVNVYNVNPDSKLNVFPKKTFEEVFGKEKLLGDHVEDALKSVGGDKIARAIEKVTKKPCGCGKRRNALNNVHTRIRSGMRKNR